jgi:hypothetical protein
MTDKEMQVQVVTARLQGRKLSYLEMFRDDIVKGVIKKARPIPLWRAFYLSTVRTALWSLKGHEENEAFKLLAIYDYKGYFGIPRAIRRRIPELIREALGGGR